MLYSGQPAQVAVILLRAHCYTAVSRTPWREGNGPRRAMRRWRRLAMQRHLIYFPSTPPLDDEDTQRVSTIRVDVGTFHVTCDAHFMPDYLYVTLEQR